MLISQKFQTAVMSLINKLVKQVEEVEEKFNFINLFLKHKIYPVIMVGIKQWLYMILN